MDLDMEPMVFGFILDSHQNSGAYWKKEQKVLTFYHGQVVCWLKGGNLHLKECMSKPRPRSNDG